MNEYLEKNTELQCKNRQLYKVIHNLITILLSINVLLAILFAILIILYQTKTIKIMNAHYPIYVYYISFCFNVLLMILNITSLVLFKQKTKPQNITISLQLYIISLVLNLFYIGFEIFFIKSADYSTTGDIYGPIFQQFNQTHIQLHFWTKKQVESVIFDNQNISVIDYKIQSNYHNFYITNTDLHLLNDQILFNNKQYTINFKLEQTKISKFIQVSDIHGNASIINQVYKTDHAKQSDLIVMTGDLSDSSDQREYYATFAQAPNKPIYFIQGNHDETEEVFTHQQRNYYQQAGNIGFFTINILYQVKVNKQYVDEAIQFLNNIINTTADEHKYILCHSPVYSTGYFGTNKYFAQQIEEFLDRNKNQNIRAVLSGHDHSLQFYIRKGIVIATCTPTGGKRNVGQNKFLKGPQIKEEIDPSKPGYFLYYHEYTNHGIDAFCTFDFDYQNKVITYTAHEVGRQKITYQYNQSFG